MGARFLISHPLWPSIAFAPRMDCLACLFVSRRAGRVLESFDWLAVIRI